MRRRSSIATRPGCSNWPGCAYPNVPAGAWTRKISFKRPRITLTPSIVFRDNKPLLAVSVAGGDEQDQISLQLILNHIDFGLAPADSRPVPIQQWRCGSKDRGSPRTRTKTAQWIPMKKSSGRTPRLTGRPKQPRGSSTQRLRRCSQSPGR